MAKREVELSSTMGEAIIQHLSALGPLPSEGYLAGQAVSSALFELFVEGGEGLSVYNDLDIFYPVTDDDEMIVRRGKRTLRTVRFHDVRVSEDYGHLNLDVTHAYDIVRSHRAGLVNLIAFDNLSYGHRTSRLLSLLQGFDLNCTQVGVCLATRRLEWTPAFTDFANTRQLQICNVQTPHHTAMRWFKKRRELPGAYGRDEDAMELVSLLSHAKGMRGDTRLLELDHLRWRFGSKNARMYEDYRGELAPYFDLVKDDESFFYLSANQRPDEDMIAIAKSYPTRSIAQVFNDVRAPRKAAKRARVESVLRSGPVGKDRALSMSLGSYLTQGGAYLGGNVDVERLKAADAFAATHRVLVPYLWNLSATHQVAEHAAWMALEKRFGQWIFGHIEVQVRRHRADNFSHGDLPADAWVAELEAVAVESLNADALLVDHPRFEATFGEYRVCELLTRGELLAEGNELHHCVGGYASEVREKRSRILQIRHPDRSRWSTVEVDRWARTEGWRALQHFSFCNQQPHMETEALLESILLELDRKSRVDQETESTPQHLQACSDPENPAGPSETESDAGCCPEFQRSHGVADASTGRGWIARIAKVTTAFLRQLMLRSTSAHLDESCGKRSLS